MAKKPDINLERDMATVVEVGWRGGQANQNGLGKSRGCSGRGGLSKGMDENSSETLRGVPFSLAMNYWCVIDHFSRLAWPMPFLGCIVRAWIVSKGLAGCWRSLVLQDVPYGIQKRISKPHTKKRKLMRLSDKKEELEDSGDSRRDFPAKKRRLR